jgi:ABC-type uncharacterized transport system substrate-binding protein
MSVVLGTDIRGRLRRRAVACALAGTALGLAASSRQHAQQVARRRIGVLASFGRDSVPELLSGLRGGFAAQGMVVGRDVMIELRHADNQNALLAPLAADLEARDPDVIIALGPTATEAVLEATPGGSLPIVSIGDVVAAGHASQLGRPGGRVTGLSFIPLALNTKRLELLAIYQWPETAREGGLLGYGPSSVSMFRQLAGYAARILRGAKPAELPIEQPTKVEFVVNLKTARLLGLTIPQALLLRADEVIQ